MSGARRTVTSAQASTTCVVDRNVLDVAERQRTLNVNITRDV